MTARRREVSSAVRLRVLQRDGYRCVYCGKNGADAELHVDHRVPVAKGGSNHIGNLNTSCAACNQSKGAGPEPAPAPRETSCASVGSKPARRMVKFTVDGQPILMDASHITGAAAGWADAVLHAFGCRMPDGATIHYTKNGEAWEQAVDEDIDEVMRRLNA